MEIKYTEQELNSIDKTLLIKLFLNPQNQVETLTVETKVLNGVKKEFFANCIKMGRKQVRIISVLYKRKEECCWCTACYAVCPRESISMIEDEEGFLYPQINERKCIRCY